MSDQEIKSNLCYYDRENPNNDLGCFEEEDRPEPRENCYCDNCFYGRDKLAMQILETQRERNEAREALRVLFDDYKQLADSGDAGFWELEDKPAAQPALRILQQREAAK